LLGMRVRGASMTDGLLDVIVVERLTLARLALAIGDTLIGRHEPVHRVSTHRVTALRVSSEEDHEVAVDGEVGGCVPFEFTVLPGAIRVVVPAHPSE
jgi:diacylglycerol kinase (ATP)